MILGSVSLIDCVAFCFFLAPQLVIQAGLFPTLSVVLQALPFLLFRLPFQFVLDRYYRDASSLKSAYLKGSTVFEDIVIRCVRYSFKNMPSAVGRVFFSKEVALPFTRWRMMRHGLTDFPVHWEECTVGEVIPEPPHQIQSDSVFQSESILITKDIFTMQGSTGTKGVWIRHDPAKDPDIVIFYAHGGGFVMGSCYFYLEFLFAWHELLRDAGYSNPAIFALDYSLVPDEVYPTQVFQTLEGYRHVLQVAKDASRICVAGDSAGGTLILSLLLELGAQIRSQQMNGYGCVPGPHDEFTQGVPPAYAIPRMATLISPWVTLVSNLHYPSHLDYLDRGSLWKYGCEYAGDTLSHRELSSPGMCQDKDLWKLASPERGFFITYGGEEVLSPDIEDLVGRLDRARVEVEARRFDGGIHAWPITSIFLSSTRRKRLYGLRTIVGEIRKRFDKMPIHGKQQKTTAVRLDQVGNHGEV